MSSEASDLAWNDDTPIPDEVFERMPAPEQAEEKAEQNYQAYQFDALDFAQHFDMPLLKAHLICEWLIDKGKLKPIEPEQAEWEATCNCGWSTVADQRIADLEDMVEFAMKKLDYIENPHYGVDNYAQAEEEPEQAEEKAECDHEWDRGIVSKKSFCHKCGVLGSPWPDREEQAEEKAELYQCPYEEACKCAMDEPCKGCETWAMGLRKQAEPAPEKADSVACRHCGEGIFREDHAWWCYRDGGQSFYCESEKSIAGMHEPTKPVQPKPERCNGTEQQRRTEIISTVRDVLDWYLTDGEA